METVFIIIIVGLAAAYLVKTFTGKSNKEDSCGCGCTACPTASQCDDKDETAQDAGTSCTEHRQENNDG